MPTRDDLDRAAACWSLSLKSTQPSASVLRSFQKASARIQRQCETGASHYATEKVLDAQVLVRNVHRQVGWCAARKFFRKAVVDDDLWSFVTVTEASTDAVGARSAAIDGSSAAAASERSSRGADASISSAVGPASSSAAWNQAPPLKQRRLSHSPPWLWKVMLLVASRRSYCQKRCDCCSRIVQRRAPTTSRNRSSWAADNMVE